MAELEFNKKEIDTFVEEWGQSHSEICANLDYPKRGSDDLLMIDYFWYAPKKQWLPKFSSMYNEREEALADFLRFNS